MSSPAHPGRPLRPRAETFRVADLVDMAQRGVLRVPSFQRPIRWKATDVESLFDSIWRGYPVGSLLLWARPGPAEEVRLGAVTVAAAAQDRVFYVVDGQQRVSALVSALAPGLGAGSPTYAIWFDLDHGVFVRPSPTVPLGSRWLPLAEVLDSVRLNTWFSEHPVLDFRSDAFRLALQLNKVVNEFTLPAYVVESEDESAVREIFTRLNNAGAPMRASEVFAALHGTTDRPAPLARLRKTMEEAQVGSVQDKWLIRCLRVVAGDDLSKPFRQTVEAYADVVDSTVLALDSALSFLREPSTGVPHLSLLPTVLPLVSLVGYFHGRAEPGPRERVLLRRWLWRGFVTRRHRDTGNPHLREVSRIAGLDWRSALRALQEDAGCPDDGNIEAFAAEVATDGRTRSALTTRVLGLLLLRRGPLDIDTGQPLDVDSLLDQAGPGALQNVAGGKGSPPEYVVHRWLPELRQRLNDASPSIQESHCWAVSGQCSDRQKLLSASMVADLLRLCEPGQSDHLPLCDIMGRGGEE